MPAWTWLSKPASLSSALRSSLYSSYVWSSTICLSHGPPLSLHWICPELVPLRRLQNWPFRSATLLVLTTLDCASLLLASSSPILLSQSCLYPTASVLTSNISPLPPTVHIYRHYGPPKAWQSYGTDDRTLSGILQGDRSWTGYLKSHPTSLQGEYWRSAELDQIPVGPVRRSLLPLVDWGDLIDIDRYCTFTEKDPLITIKEVSINVLYVFFDWLLLVRKDTLSAASTLQTYWNVFCLVRKKITGFQEIDPLIKSQMQEVRKILLISILR